MMTTAASTRSHVFFGDLLAEVVTVVVLLDPLLGMVLDPLLSVVRAR
jgi:hypothetical protein